jgi:hypothetical protein
MLKIFVSISLDMINLAVQFVLLPTSIYVVTGNSYMVLPKVVA